MRICQAINQSAGVPEQCRDCRFLGQCMELGCLKNKPCASRIEKEPPEIREEIRTE